jgi:RNA polymerase sigma-70 factor (ECF subfamily)
MDDPAPTDAQLLEEARRSPDAFGAFYERHGAALLSFLVRRARDPEAGADLTAEVFAAALDGIDRFDARRADPLAWLYGIARHKLADYYRTGYVESRARRRLGMPRRAIADEALERVEQLASLDVSAVIVRGALAELPADQRAAIVARVVEEQDYRAMSHEADVSEGAIRQRVARGLTTLRHRLGDLR